jgi:PIN domain nuclease of toxin-antitoxin system
LKLLLDSHVLVWFLSDPGRLRPETVEILRDRSHTAYYSPASVWELEIKRKSGKLILPESWWPEVADLGFGELPIATRHAVLAARLPPHHQDPFDRMLVAQSLEEACCLVSRDAVMDLYRVPLWKA